MEIEVMLVSDLKDRREQEVKMLESKLQNSPDEKFLEWFKESGATTCPSQIESMTGVSNPQTINTVGKALLARQVAGETLEKAWCFIHNEPHEDDLEDVFCIKHLFGKEYLFAVGWEALGIFLLRKAQVISEV
jgi:hypothetical protein